MYYPAILENSSYTISVGDLIPGASITRQIAVYETRGRARLELRVIAVSDNATVYTADARKVYYV